MRLETVKESIIMFSQKFSQDLKQSLAKVSTETIGWIGVLLLHAATIPSMISLMFGLTDATPPIDIVLIVWAALGMFFMKAIIQRDILNLITIGLGFIMQATLMALVFFK
jgi:hypothetical protein